MAVEKARSRIGNAGDRVRTSKRIFDSLDLISIASETDRTAARERDEGKDRIVTAHEAAVLAHEEQAAARLQEGEIFLLFGRGKRVRVAESNIPNLLVGTQICGKRIDNSHAVANRLVKSFQVRGDAGRRSRLRRAARAVDDQNLSMPRQGS